MSKERLVPKCRFEEFEGDWEKVKLKNFAKFKRGRGYSRKDIGSEGIPLILYGRLYTNYETVIKEVDTFTEKRPNSIISEGGEVIVPASGESPEEIAVASVVKYSGYILGSDLNIITPNEGLNSVFLAMSVSNGEVKNELSKRAQGATITHIRNNDIKEARIFTPSLAEQEKIGSFFSKLDEMIELQSEIVEESKNYKKGMLQKLFPQKGEKLPRLRFEGFDGEWEEVKLKDVCKVQNGFAFKSSEFGSGDKKIIRISNLLLNGSVGGEFATIEANQKYENNKVYGGEYLIAMSGATTGKVAKNHIEGYVNQRVGVFKHFSNCNNDFLGAIVESNNFQHFIKSSWGAGAQPNVSATQIGKYKFLLPSLAEQEAIGSFFEKLDEKIKLEENKLEEYKLLKKSFLQKMFV